MSVISDLIYGGANAVAGIAESAVNDAIAKYGPEKEISFPDTDYFFPAIYATTGLKVETLEDLVPCVAILKNLITNQPGMGQALNAGLSTAVGAEIIEGLKYFDETTQETGFISDSLVRSLNVSQAPGVAVILGRADAPEDVVRVVRDYQARGILTFLVGDVIEQCSQGGVALGVEARVIPLGHDVTSMVHVGSVAVRTAIMFGGIQPGDLAGILAFTKERVPAFVNTFGTIDAVVISVGAGAVSLGFPVVVDIDLGENQIPGVLESVCDHAGTVKKSLELRDIKDHE